MQPKKQLKAVCLTWKPEPSVRSYTLDLTEKGTNARSTSASLPGPSVTLPVTKGLFLCLNSATNGCPTKGRLLFTDSCFEHQSRQVICQAVRLRSHRSEASGLSASKCLTNGDLPPLGEY